MSHDMKAPIDWGLRARTLTEIFKRSELPEYSGGQLDFAQTYKNASNEELMLSAIQHISASAERIGKNDSDSALSALYNAQEACAMMAARCKEWQDTEPDRADATNLARNVLEVYDGKNVTPKGVKCLATAVMNMDAFITKQTRFVPPEEI